MLKMDSQSAVALIKNPIFHDRSKHIDIKYHFLRDCVDGGQIVLEFVETGRQLADILTESLWSSSVLGAEGEDWHGGTQSQGLGAAGLGKEL